MAESDSSVLIVIAIVAVIFYFLFTSVSGETETCGDKYPEIICVDGKMAVDYDKCHECDADNILEVDGVEACNVEDVDCDNNPPPPIDPPNNNNDPPNNDSPNCETAPDGNLKELCGINSEAEEIHQKADQIFQSKTETDQESIRNIMNDITGWKNDIGQFVADYETEDGSEDLVVDAQSILEKMQAAFENLGPETKCHCVEEGNDINMYCGGEKLRIYTTVSENDTTDHVGNCNYNCTKEYHENRYNCDMDLRR